jgi:hypothetical protein
MASCPENYAFIAPFHGRQLYSLTHPEKCETVFGQDARQYKKWSADLI